MALPQILDYLDYREFLKDYLENIKADKPWFSLRYLGGRLDVDAGNIVKMLQKERHLPERCLSALAAELGLNSRETEYLGLLVEFSKATQAEKIRVAYERILDLKYVRPAVVGKQQYAFYRDWKPTAVLAMLHLDHLRKDEVEIADKLEPRITIQEALETLQLLEKLGLARKEKGNRWVANESLLTTGEGWKDIAIREYQRQTLKLSERSLEHHQPSERDISTLTFTLGPGDLEKIRELTKEFRRNILSIAAGTPAAERIYQMNLQLFPMSKTIAHKRGRV